MNPEDEILEINIVLPCFKGWDKKAAEEIVNKISKYVSRFWVRKRIKVRIRKPFKNER